MPPVAGDFLAPKGEIEAGFFPLDSASTLAARIQEYIDQGTAKVDAYDPPLDPDEIDVDGAIAALVYVRLYDAILLRYANTPNTTIADEGGISITSAQLAIFQNKRDEWAGAYEAIIADVVVAPTEQSSAPTSHARTIFTF